MGAENHSGLDHRLAAVEFRNITKRYGPLVANAKVDLSIARGQIHGIVGENGAGKSTLMKLLAGVEAPDEGTMALSGTAVRFHNSAEARRHGVAMVFQHFMMVDRLSVLDNLMLFHKGKLFLAAERRSLEARVDVLMRDYNMHIPVHAPFGDLPVGQRQRAEIIKLLLGDSSILILDEPTAVLTPQEVADLFRMLRRLKDEGRTILLVTHKLNEVMEICDQVTVMRQGCVVSSHRIADVTPQRLAELMIGRSDTKIDQDRTPLLPEVALSVRNLKIDSGVGHGRLDVSSLDVFKGEILGVAGVSGNGQTELLDALSGQLKPDSGTLEIAGRKVDATHWFDAFEARRFGIGHIPEDRQEAGLVRELSVLQNLVLGQEHRPANSKRGLMRLTAQAERADHLIRAFDIRTTSAGNSAGSLSGGNQQKIVVARELDAAPSVLLVGQPTRGVDIGAIQYIHQRLLEYRNAGGSILLVSAELDELFALADRLVVAYDGTLHGSFRREQFGDPRIGQHMAGLM